MFPISITGNSYCSSKARNAARRFVSEVTRIVNEAIRKNHKEAALNIAMREKAALDAKIAALTKP